MARTVLSKKPAKGIEMTRIESSLRDLNLSDNLTVRDLMRPGTQEWDHLKLQRLFPVEVIEKIMKIRAGGPSTSDTYVWGLYEDRLL